MPLFPISSFQAAQSGEQNVKVKKDEITVSPDQGGGGDTSNCFKYEQGDFIKNSQDNGEQKLLVVNEDTGDGSMIDMTTSTIDTLVTFVDPDSQDVTSGLSVNQSEVSLNVNEYEDGSHNHSYASMGLSVNEEATRKSETISKTTVFGDTTNSVVLNSEYTSMALNEEPQDGDILAAFNIGSDLRSDEGSTPGFMLIGEMKIGDVEAGEIAKSMIVFAAGSNGVVCMSDGTTIIGDPEDSDRQLVIKDGEIQGGGSKQYRHSMYIECHNSTESDYGDFTIIYNYFSNVDHSLWRDRSAGIITDEELQEMAMHFIDNAEKYSANTSWLPPHICGYVYKGGNFHAPIHSVIRGMDDKVYVHAIDVSGSGLISQATIIDVVEGDEIPGE